MITKQQEALLRDLRKSRASLGEAEKVIQSMEGVTPSEKKLALKLHIPYADSGGATSRITPAPEPPPVAEPNELLTLGNDSVFRKKSKRKNKFSFVWACFWLFAAGLIVLFAVFAINNRTEDTTDKNAKSKTAAEVSKAPTWIAFGPSSLEGNWRCTILDMQGQSVQLRLEFRKDGSVAENGVNLGNRWKNDCIVFDKAGSRNALDGVLVVCLSGVTKEHVRDLGKTVEVTLHRIDDDRFDLGRACFVRKSK